MTRMIETEADFPNLASAGYTVTSSNARLRGKQDKPREEKNEAANLAQD
jgi:hypothetical protein